MVKNQPSKTELALLWLHSFSLSEKKRDAVMGLFESPDRMLTEFESKKELLCSLLGEAVYKGMTKRQALSQANDLVKNLDSLGIRFFTRVSAEYPAALREIASSPLVLFALGDVSILNQPSVAVVGTRKPTAYGKDVAKSFCKTLAQAGLVIVSGLAYGIDSIAHMTALEENAKTIAVMAGGLDEIYPASHTTLARQIVKSGGLLISEYFPGVRPTAYSFPERNRIISGISDGLLVVEAGEKSGSLHTINYAIEQGKELFVVPANINSSASFGSNRILVEMPHALVTSAEQILERMGIEWQEHKQESLELSEEERLVLELVKREPIEFDELAQKTKIPTQTLSSLLTIMEMNGIIIRLSGNRISAKV